MLVDVLDAIARKKARLDRLRPLRTDAIAQLQKHYDVELTYTSNAIEGNTLTLRETAEVVEHGVTVGGKSLREHLEAVDHYEALLWMRDLAAETTPDRRQYRLRVASTNRRAEPAGHRRDLQPQSQARP